MLFFRGGGGAGGGAGGMAAQAFVRYFSRKRSVDVRRINPKVPREEAKAISASLYQILKEHGPLSVGNTWNHVKEAGISGINSKTHMKIMLKWMTGRNMLKLSCTHVGSAKRFHYSSFPVDPQAAPKTDPPSTVSDTPKPSRQATKKSQNPSKRK